MPAWESVSNSPIGTSSTLHKVSCLYKSYYCEDIDRISLFLLSSGCQLRTHCFIAIMTVMLYFEYIPSMVTYTLSKIKTFINRHLQQNIHFIFMKNEKKLVHRSFTYRINSNSTPAKCAEGNKGKLF